MMKRFPHYLQHDAMDCGPTCLRMIAKYYGKSYSLQTLRERSFITREGALDAQVPLIASAVGGLRDFLCDGENALLFEDNNTGELLSAYDKLDFLRQKLISGGNTTAKEYNWQTITARLIDIYRESL